MTPLSEECSTTGRWIFFRTPADGRSVFEKEFDKLPNYARAALAVLMRRYLNDELVSGDIKPVRDDAMELRWRQLNNQFRILFFRWGPHAVALSAFYKNQQKTPKAKVDNALDRMKAWRRTFGNTPSDGS